MKNFFEMKVLLENDHAKNDLHKIIQYSEKLQKIIDNIEIEDWVRAKLTHAEDYINTVLDYIKYYKTEEKNKMALGDLKSINSKAKEIMDLINNVELRDWVKAKINLAGEYLDDIYHHLDYKKIDESKSNIQYAGFFKDGRIIVYIDGKKYEYITPAFYHERWKRMHIHSPYKVLNQIKKIAKSYE